jgi:hypothetical protein
MRGSGKVVAAPSYDGETGLYVPPKYAQARNSTFKRAEKPNRSSGRFLFVR